jgi:hypothetical protein
MDDVKASSSKVEVALAADAAAAALWRSRLDSRRNRVDILPVKPLAGRGGCVTKFPGMTSGTTPPLPPALLLNGGGAMGDELWLPNDSIIALEMASSIPSTLAAAPGLTSLVLLLVGVDLCRRNRRAGMMALYQ